MNRVIRLLTQRSGGHRDSWLWVAVPLLAFVWFWFWRSGLWVGGDSEQWEREINGGLWSRKRQVLSFVVLQLANTTSRLLVEWSTRYVFNLVSCLAGALAMLVLWRLLHERPAAPWAFAVVATAGFTTVFYGHIETYAQPVAALLLHLLAIERTIASRWAPWTIVATFCLVMAFHLVVLFALPAVVVVTIAETHRRREGAIAPLRSYGHLALATLPGVVLWMMIWRWKFGYGELVGPHFIAPLDELIRRPWLVFIHDRVHYKINFMFWNAGLMALVALWAFVRGLRSPPRDRFTLYLLAYFLCFLVFTAVWNPDAGDSDFDLFCFPWVIACVAVAWHVNDLPWRPMLLGLILGVNVYLWITRPLVFADLHHRGYGTILFESSFAADEAHVRLNDRLLLFPVNRKVPAGPCQIKILRLDRRQVSRRIVNLRPGDTYSLILNDSGLQVNPIHVGQD